jgi:hypothetical protein
MEQEQLRNADRQEFNRLMFNYRGRARLQYGNTSVTLVNPNRHSLGLALAGLPATQKTALRAR